MKVKGSKGKFVEIEMLGVNEVIKRLRREGKQIEGASDLGVIQAGGFIEEEVKESIAGNRAEVKSVDTGRFANSIEFNKTGKAEGVVKPIKKNYPGTSTTTQDVAVFMEYGTSRILPRLHFTNTKTRNKKKIRDIIQAEINKVV